MTNYWHTFYENCFYHIYNRSNNKETIFLTDENYQFFLRRWKKYFKPFFDTYSYALIPNHFHFCVKVKKVDDPFLKAVYKQKTAASRKFLQQAITLDEFIEDQMRRFGISYAKSFNSANNRHGSVFQKRFKRIQIKTPPHVQWMITYHHHNPIHHKLAREYGVWKYTSYQEILSNTPTQICRNEVLKLFHFPDSNKLIEQFIDYHANFKLQKRAEHLLFEKHPNTK